MSTLAKGLVAVALLAALAIAYDAYKKHEANSFCEYIQKEEPLASAIQKAHERGFEYNKNLYDHEAENNHLLFYGALWYHCLVEIQDGKVRDRNVIVRD